MNPYRAMLRIHQWIYRTTGRRTGRTRTNALIYARDGDTYLVVASNGGAPRAPTWLANLTANPHCEIQIRRRRMPVTARPTRPDDPDYARRWTIVDTVNRGRYTRYQRMTRRTIPIVELR